MTSPPYPLLAALTDTQWTVLGGGFGALLVAITTISVAMINSRAAAKQNKKDESAVVTVGELTISLSATREELAGVKAELSSAKSEIRWLRKQQEKDR